MKVDSLVIKDYWAHKPAIASNYLFKSWNMIFKKFHNKIAKSSAPFYINFMSCSEFQTVSV